MIVLKVAADKQSVLGIGGVVELGDQRIEVDWIGRCERIRGEVIAVGQLRSVGSWKLRIIGFCRQVDAGPQWTGSVFGAVGIHGSDLSRVQRRGAAARVHVGKITRAKARQWNFLRDLLILRRSLSLIGHEVEDLVLLEWCAKGSAEGVTQQLRRYVWIP